MALTYTAIATVTVGSGGAANVEFTSIPGTYTDLVVLHSLRGESAGPHNVKLNLNGSTSTMKMRSVESNGVSVGSDTSTTQMYVGVCPGSTQTASTFSNSLIYIPNYASANNKSSSGDGASEANSSSASQAYLNLNANLWSNTNAITTITLALSSGNIAQYSTATLYGIKNTV